MEIEKIHISITLIFILKIHVWIYYTFRRYRLSLFSTASTLRGNTSGHETVEQARTLQLLQGMAESISHDTELRDELRGWHHVCDRWIENDYGSCFQIDT